MKACGLIVALLLAIPAHAEPASVVSLEKRVAGVLEGFRARDSFPGATAAFVLADGRAGSVAIGLADEQDAVPMRIDQRAMSGSIGKTFVAATALALAREGRLDLDAPISRWIGDAPWFARLPNAEKLTTRILLRHAGGLENHPDWTSFWLRAVWARILRGPDARLSPEACIELVLDRPPLFEAGHGYHYTDTGYLVVGLVLERAAGRSYEREITERFLRPLGLEHTAPADRRDLPGLMAGQQTQFRFLPRRVVDDQGALRFNPASEWTGGGLVTTSADLAHWAKELYEGRAMDGAYLNEVLREPSDAGNGLRYGLGVFLYPETSLGPAWGHGGWFPGYHSHVLFFPERGLAVAVQVNRHGDTDTREYATAIAEVLVGGE